VGQSVVERLFDRLLAFDSTTQGAAQLVYKAHLRTYKVEGLRDIIAMGGPALEGLLKQINFIRATQTNEGMTLLDSKDEFEAHSYAFGGLDTVLLQFGQQQERRLRTGVGLLLQLSYQSAFGKPMPEGSDFGFRPLSGLSDEQKAGVASTLTSSVQGGFTTGLVGRQTALKELRGQSRLTGTWTNISDEDVEAADNDVTAPGELGVEPPPPDGAAVEEEDEDQKRAVA
jgi:hypothetical protein